MPLDPTTRVSAVAHDLLDAVTTTFDDADVALPSRQYLHVGEPAWDCNELVVTLRRIRPGFPADAEEPQLVRAGIDSRVAVFEVLLLRCATSLDDTRPPGAAQLQAESEDRLIDGWLLPHGLVLAKHDGTHFTGCTQVSVGEAFAVGPEGNLAGWRMTVEIEID